MTAITDTHAHYTDDRFREEFEGGPEALLPELFAGAVGRIINVPVTTRNSVEVLRMAERYPGMYAACGIHPTELENELPVDEAIRFLDDLIEKDRAGSKKIVAIGETGLDYHYEDFSKEQQTRYFEAQLELAKEKGLPVLIHDREAHGDCFETVLRHPGVRGVFHSYSGSPEMALELVKRGWYISFSGVITFKNAPRVRAVAETVPLDRILLETDAPYLAPVPFRGKLNRSDYIAYSAEILAQIRNMTASEIVEATSRNAEALFGFGSLHF